MLRRMSAAQDGDGRAGRPPRLALAFAALAVALVIWVIWFVTRPEEPDRSAAAAMPPAASARPHADTTARTPAAATETKPASAPAASAPTEPPASAPAAPSRDFRGKVVRASDDSAFEGATVVALQGSGTRATELGRARSDADGRFTLHASRSLDEFQVLVRDPSWVPDDPRPGQPVTAGVEWGGTEDAPEVRLVLQTGWQLDVRVADARGVARAGVVVSAAGRSATTDVAGRCRLLDLPAGGELQLTATAAGAPPVTQAVSPPTTGLRQDLLITVP
jgi:hypothetical protein